MQVSVFPGKVEYQDNKFDAILPKIATTEAAGVDVSTPYSFVLKSGETHLLNTGLIIKAPREHCILVLPRSGLATKKSVTIANTPGLIDRDYCGPEDFIKIALVNRGSEDVAFERGDRVAQLLFIKYVSPVWQVQTEPSFSQNISRGGFGSTGVA